MLLSFFRICINDQLLVLAPYCFLVCQAWEIKQHLNQIAAPGEVPKMVWWVKQTTQAASMMNCSFSAGLKSFLSSNPAVYCQLHHGGIIK